MRERKDFVRYSAEQLSNLRQTDMVDFLQTRYGYSFRSEAGAYRCEQHDSLVVNSNRMRWFYNSRGIGGNNVIDWFASIEGIGFQECCKIMIGSQGEGFTPTYHKAPEKPIVKEKKPFIPPACHENSRYSRVYMYLTKTRCIAPAIVKRLFSEKKLYQEEKYGNCVFAEYDENGIMKFAERRSTSTYKKFSSTGKEIKFRPTVESADYTYGFHIDCDAQNSIKDRLYVFEAPIDLLSHCTLTNIKAKSDDAYRAYNRLSLSGVSDIALAAYLEKHKDIKTIVWCLDNDVGGRKAATKYTEKYTALGYNCISAPVTFGKDYNELLCEVTRRMNAPPAHTVSKAEVTDELHEQDSLRKTI